MTSGRRPLRYFCRQGPKTKLHIDVSPENVELTSRSFWNTASTEQDATGNAVGLVTPIVSPRLRLVTNDMCSWPALDVESSGGPEQLRNRDFSMPLSDTARFPDGGWEQSARDTPSKALTKPRRSHIDIGIPSACDARSSNRWHRGPGRLKSAAMTRTVAQISRKCIVFGRLPP
jgi:hypothetical protein